jgi:hypothetical protein
MKSGNLNFLEPSGPLQACNGTALPLRLRFKITCVRVKLHHIPYNQIHISLRELNSHGKYNDGNCLPRHGACSAVWYTDVSEEPATSIIIRIATASSSELSVHVYHRARRHVPEDGYLHISLLLLPEGRCSSHAKMFRSVNLWT